MVMQARAQATHAAIIQAALDLFEDSGYGSTGLTDIINKAAVTKGAFYYHFHTKESVAAAVVEGSYEEIHRLLVTTIEAPSGPALENLIRATFAVAEAMRRNQLVRVGHQLRLVVPAVLKRPIAKVTGGKTASGYICLRRAYPARMSANTGESRWSCRDTGISASKYAE